MPPISPWDRQPGESSKAFRAWCLFRDLGIDRSIYKAGQEFSRLMAKRGRSVGARPHVNFERFSVRFNWIERARLYDDYLLEKARSAREAVILEELKNLRVDQLALANERIKFELRGHRSTEAFFDGLEAKFKDIVRLPSTSVKRQKFNEAGDVIEAQEMAGLKPTELTRVVRQAMDCLAQGVHGNVRVSQTERIAKADDKPIADGGLVPMELVFNTWPEDQQAEESTD